MHSWIKSNKGKFEQVSVNKRVLKIDMSSFSEQQKLAYDIVHHHSQSDMSDPLLLIINGVFLFFFIFFLFYNILFYNRTLLRFNFFHSYSLHKAHN